MNESCKKRNSFAHILQFDIRFLMFATAIVGVGILWWKDRQRLEERLAAIELRYQPFVGNAWSVEQATGKPNTIAPGDKQTAWASMTPDGQEEWLELNYEYAVRTYAVEIHESFNPGAVSKVTTFDASNNEVILWQGTDPTPATEKSGVSKIPLMTPVLTDRIRIYLDSKNVSGWNEIDAVGLHYGFIDTVIWANKASASSSFGTNGKWSSYSFSY